MKKILAIFLLFFGFVSVSFAYEDYSDEAFNRWVKEVSYPTQNVGLGIDEGTFALQYQVNTNFGLMDVSKTNWYSDFIVNNYRAEFLEEYDILNNKGFKGIQIMPFAGFGLDLSTADFSFITGIKTRYNFDRHWGIEGAIKYFLVKQVTYGTKQTMNPVTLQPESTEYVEDKDTDPDKRFYFSVFITYNF